MHQLTEDHTLTAQMIKKRKSGTGPGTGQPLPARHHECRRRQRKPASRWRPAHSRSSLAIRLLLCSDGLTETVTNDVIAGILNAEPAPEAAATLLLAEANKGAAADNITAVVVRFDLAD